MRVDDRHLTGPGPRPLDRALIWIEAAGHGAHLLRRNGAESVPENQKKFIRYVPHHRFNRSMGHKDYQGPEDNVLKRLLEEAGWEGIRTVWPYRIESLWDLFQGMYSDGRSLDEKTELFAKKLRKEKIQLGGFKRDTHAQLDVYKALLGRHGGNNKAHFPWGQGNDYDRLFDPVAMMLKREDKGQTHKKSHAPVSCEYLFNPYLESLLSGEIVGWSETACPEFPEKFRKLQRRRQKRCAD